ncbi:hypothetical protein DFH06DRAFT_1314601 [Mycena polygramma]|nr:hypothetical protein DFH06DRAFT_1314601 [Mycena polygramma]
MACMASERIETSIRVTKLVQLTHLNSRRLSGPSLGRSKTQSDISRPRHSPTFARSFDPNDPLEGAPAESQPDSVFPVLSTREEHAVEIARAAPTFMEGTTSTAVLDGDEFATAEKTLLSIASPNSSLSACADRTTLTWVMASQYLFSQQGAPLGTTVGTLRDRS